MHDGVYESNEGIGDAEETVNVDVDVYVGVVVVRRRNSK